MKPSGSSTSYANQRSWLYGYDKLNRLVAADAGKFVSVDDPIDPSTLVPKPRIEDWYLDNLGNWVGDTHFPGYVVDNKALGGSVTQECVTHNTDLRNEIDSITTDPDGAGTGTPTTATQVYDKGGHLVADEEYFYQYDAWGRMVSVHEFGTSLTFDSQGKASGTPGNLVQTILGVFL